MALARLLETACVATSSNCGRRGRRQGAHAQWKGAGNMDVASILAGAMAARGAVPATAGAEPSPFRQRAAHEAAGSGGGTAAGAAAAGGLQLAKSKKKGGLLRELSALVGDQGADALPPLVRRCKVGHRSNVTRAACPC